MTNSKLNIWSPRPDALPQEQIAPQVCLYGLPAIAIVPIALSEAQRQYIAQAEALLFVSAHAVQCLMDLWGADAVTVFSSKQLIAIGHRTESALQGKGLSVFLTAKPPFNSEALLADPRFQSLSATSVALICGVGGREILQKALQKKDKEIRRIACYRRDKCPLPAQVMVEFINKCAIGGILLTSCAVAEAVASALSACEREAYWQLPVFALSHRIAEHARGLGFSQVVSADSANRQALYAMIVDWQQQRMTISAQ